MTIFAEKEHNDGSYGLVVAGGGGSWCRWFVVQLETSQRAEVIPFFAEPQVLSL
jgi:hypothetical protein